MPDIEKDRSPISGVSGPNRFEIEISVDSGGCSTVMPTKLCAFISTLANSKSRSGVGYEVASG